MEQCPVNDRKAVAILGLRTLGKTWDEVDENVRGRRMNIRLVED